MTAPDEIGARLSLRDRPQFERDANAAARSVENIGDAAPRAEQKSRGAFSAIGAGIMGVGGAAIRAGGLLAAGLGAGAVAAVGLGVSTAAGMEQASISFTTMLGSAEKAQTFLADLNTFAAKTPFDLPGLQRSASSLISAGIEADKVIPIMTSLGNATSGMGTGAEGVQRATVALQQMSAAGRITGEDLNQLRDAGVPVFDLLAAATGKSVEEVAALAQAGKLGKTELDQLMGALESGRGLERFNGLMEAQSASMSGLWSTLKDTFSVGMAQAVEPLIPMIKGGLGGAIEFTSGLMPKIQARLKGMADGAAFLGGVLFKGDFKGDNIFGLDESDKAVDRLFDIREGVIAAKAAFTTGGTTGMIAELDGILGTGTKVADTFGVMQGVWDDLSAVLTGVVLPAILDVTGAIDPGWLTPLGAARAILGLVADNAGLFRVVLTGLIAAMILYKGIVIAANVVGAIRNAQLWLAFVRTGSLTGATVAQAIAIRTVSAVTKAYTAVQWLLNAAMTANPIGLVIIALVALGAAFYLLWTKSETFRRIVTGAFNAVRNAAGVAADWIKSKWQATMGWFGSLKMPSVSWDGIKSGFRGAINWIIDKWNNLSFRLPSVDTKIPGVGRVGGMTMSTPDIPRLHNGGTVTSGGVVNMRPDEELIFLPPSASVVPLPNDTPPIDLGGPRDGGPTTVQIMLDGRVLAETVIRNVQDRVARA